MIARQATVNDLPQLMALGYGFYNESPYTKYGPISEPRLRGVLEQLINDPSMCIIVADNADGRPQGMLGLILVPVFFLDGTRHSQELFWYVAPEARKNGAGKSMMLAGEAWSRENGAHAMQMSVINGLGDSEIIRRYKKAGFRLRESNYVKELG
jgi:GNAT superfamily N-acetyltransferase